MRLLVPTRIALRRATSSPVSLAAAAAAAATRAPSHRSKTAAAAPSQSELLQRQQLQQLWELSKMSDEDPHLGIANFMKLLKETGMNGRTEAWLPHHICTLKKINDFPAIASLLELCPIKEKAPSVRLVNEVIWTAVHAKSLGTLPPSILDWIEAAVQRLPEPVPSKKESMIWLLSILRGDLPLLQQLQKDSISKRRKVGPEVERENTLRHAALAYLEVGKNEEFRSLWTSLRHPLLAEDEHSHQHDSAMVHHAILRSARSGKPDRSMLRWYAECLAEHQRTPIPTNPQLDVIMGPVVRALGGKIEKWEEGDERVEKLRKWRDDYDDAELDNLVNSMLDYIKHQVLVLRRGSSNDLGQLKSMLERLKADKSGKKTVVVDWLNFAAARNSLNINSLFPSRSLVVVGRERSKQGDCTSRSPKETDRIKVMEVIRKREIKQEVDDYCTLILAVATRGHLLSNDKTKTHIAGFRKFLMAESRDVNQSTLLKNYLNDAVLRHSTGMFQPLVGHSKAAQWIDKEKKELAFTVARQSKSVYNSPFRFIDYYSLHID